MTHFSNVNVGLAPNDGTGDSLRDSFIILNNNFSYINQVIWPDISQAELTANINSSYISKFNLVQAATVESNLFGNAASQYSGANASITGNVSVGNLVVNGTATISSYSFASLNNTIIGNAIPAAGTFSNLASQTDIAMSGNLTGVGYIIKTINNLFDSNIASPLALTLSPGSARRSITGLTINTNVTITYSTITTGAERQLVLKNYQDGTDRQIVLPNSFNNKGNVTIPLGANSSMLLHFIPFDTTSANVYVNITNT